MFRTAATFALLLVAATARTVLVTGATGRTGRQVYKSLKQEQGVTVRALVRDVGNARTVLELGSPSVWRL